MVTSGKNVVYYEEISKKKNILYRDDCNWFWKKIWKLQGPNNPKRHLQARGNPVPLYNESCDGARCRKPRSAFIGLIEENHSESPGERLMMAILHQLDLAVLWITLMRWVSNPKGSFRWGNLMKPLTWRSLPFWWSAGAVSHSWVGPAGWREAWRLGFFHDAASRWSHEWWGATRMALDFGGRCGC